MVRIVWLVAVVAAAGTMMLGCPCVIVGHHYLLGSTDGNANNRHGIFDTTKHWISFHIRWKVDHKWKQLQSKDWTICVTSTNAENNRKLNVRFVENLKFRHQSHDEGVQSCSTKKTHSFSRCLFWILYLGFPKMATTSTVSPRRRVDVDSEWHWLLLVGVLCVVCFLRPPLPQQWL